MIRAKVVAWLFAVVSVLSFVAALIPVLKGKPVNAVFLGSGGVFLIIAVASAIKVRAGNARPSAD